MGIREFYGNYKKTLWIIILIAVTFLLLFTTYLVGEILKKKEDDDKDNNHKERNENIKEVRQKTIISTCVILFVLIGGFLIYTKIMHERNDPQRLIILLWIPFAIAFDMLMKSRIAGWDITFLDKNDKFIL